MKTSVHILALLLSFAGTCLKAQTVASALESNLQVHFLKDSLEFEENGFEFNNVTLLYTGPGKIDVQVSYTTPLFINVLSSTSLQSFQLNSSEQHILPIRFNSTSIIPNNTWYPFTVSIQVGQTGQRITRIFWLRQKLVTKWKCGLMQPALTVRETDPFVDFLVRIENTGSTPDTYEVEVESDLEVQIPKKDRQVQLQAGQYALVKATAVLKAGQAQQLKSAEVHIYVRNKVGDKRLLVQKITCVGHTYTQDFYKWKKMPLTLELGALNLGSGYVSYVAALDGMLDLNKGRALLLQFRTNDLINGIRTNSSTSTVSYVTPDWKIVAGSFVDFNHFLINGNGAKIRRTTGKDGYVEAMLAKGRTEKTKQLDFRTEQQVGKHLRMGNNSFVNLDDTRGINSYLTVGNLDWDFHSGSKLRIEGGGGLEKFIRPKGDTIRSGPMYGYEFESGPGRWLVTSQVSSYSKNFPGLNKGFQYHNHELKFAPNPFFVSAFYQANRKVMANPVDSFFRLLFNTDEREYGLHTGYAHKMFSMNISASRLQQQQDSANSLVSRMAKLSLSLNWMIGQDLSFSLFSNGGAVRVRDRPDLGQFFSFNNVGSLQLRSVGLHFLYDRGPFYYFEIKQYAAEKRKFERLQLAPFFQRQFDRFNSFVRVELNYSRERPLDMDFLMATGQFSFTSVKLGMDVGLLGSFDLNNQRRPSMNFTVRKKLQAPVYKNSQSYSFTVQLFLDRNGNGVFDAGDESIRNANVVANQTWLSTDANGEIEFRNVPNSPVTLDLSKVANVPGWIPRQGSTQAILPEKNRKKIGIAFKQGKVINGRLALIVDDKSAQTMSLADIRITATDSNGNTYQTLTDQGGAFNLSLPAGEYIVSINEQVFDDQFKPVEYSKAVNLNDNNLMQLVFEIRQRKRQINIRRD